MSIAAIGGAWAAFSPASGDTQLLNDEAAAVLEVLAASPSTLQEVVRAIASDSDQPIATVEDRLEGSFSLLQAAGLIEEVAPVHSFD